MASKAPRQTEGKPSSSCRCIKSWERYDGCGHTETTMIPSQGCPADCKGSGESTARYNWSCPECAGDGADDFSLRSSTETTPLHSTPNSPMVSKSMAEAEKKESGGSDAGEDGHAHEYPPGFPTAEQLIRSQITEAERLQNPRALRPPPWSELFNGEGVRKVKQANKELKKIIATLAFTGRMEEIFDAAEKELVRVHENSWDLEANKNLLNIVVAAKKGDDEEVERIMDAFYHGGFDYNANAKRELIHAKKNVIKQCEDGVERMLVALEKTGL